jgi:hypothetical protein
MNRKVTPEIVEKIKAMALSGMSAPKAAKQLGLDPGTVKKHARAAGIPFKDPYHVGFITTWNGYRMIQMPDHPEADSKGYVREHRIIAERKLGRPLTKEEVAHHDDENKVNNIPENLEVMPRKQHARLHAIQQGLGTVIRYRPKEIVSSADESGRSHG